MSNNDNNIVQIFKVDPSKWFDLWRVYNKDSLKKVPSKYIDFQNLMEDANDAIEKAGEEGVDSISENPESGHIFSLNSKITKLENFSHKIVKDADDLVDSPFFTNMVELLQKAIDDSELRVNYGGEVYDVGIDDGTPESIQQLFQDLLDKNDLDSELYTNDEKTNDRIKELHEYDYRKGKFKYEEALDNWDNLSADDQEILRHMFEYYFRTAESHLSSDSAEDKKAREILARMLNHMYRKKVYAGSDEFEGNNAAKGLLSLMNPYRSHSYKVLDDVANMDANVHIYSPDDNGKETDSYITECGNYSYFTVEYNKAGIEFKLHNEYIWNPEYFDKNGKFSRTYTVSYYTSLTRCLEYVDEQERLHKGCYDYQKKLGISKNLIADILLAADSSTDMEYLDNLTKSNGQSYDKIFMDPKQHIDRGPHDGITKSGMAAVVMYNNLLSQKYYAFHDEEARQEAARMNRFLIEMPVDYAVEYSNAYNLILYEMTFGDLNIPSNMGLGEAFLLGLESEFCVWPTALNQVFQAANESHVVYMPMDEMANIDVVKGSYDPDNNSDSYYAIRKGLIEGKSIQERLLCYKYVGEHSDVTGERLNAEALQDLRNIYYSYLKYAQEQKINLYATEKEQEVLDSLYSILYNNDKVFRDNEKFRLKDAKVSEAQKAHPHMLNAGKIVGDVVIYAGASFMTAGLGGAELVGTFAGNVLKGTALDIMIKDLPRAVTSYAKGEDFGTVAEQFTKEVILDVVANTLGEAVGDGISALKSSASDAAGKRLFEGFSSATNKSSFLKDLSHREIASLLSQMDSVAAKEVLSHFSDDATKSILKKLSPNAAEYVVDRIIDSAQAEGKEALIKELASEGLLNNSQILKALNFAEMPEDIIDSLRTSGVLDDVAFSSRKAGFDDSTNVLKNSGKRIGYCEDNIANYSNKLKELEVIDKELQNTIDRMNSVSIDESLELFKGYNQADVIKIVKNVDVPKAALMVDSLPEAQREPIMKILKKASENDDSIKNLLDEIGNNKFIRELAKDTDRLAINKMDSWRDVLRNNGIDEEEIADIVKKPMSQRSKAEVQKMIEVQKVIEQNESKKYLSKVLTEEQALSLFDNSNSYRKGTKGFVSRIQDSKGLKTSDDYIRNFGLNYIDRNSGKAPFNNKDCVQVVRFNSEGNEKAFIPFGGNHEGDLELVSRFLTDEEKKVMQLYKQPYDGGGFTIQSSLDRPGKVIHAPGAPELYVQDPIKYKTGFMYNIDKNGKETLIGIYHEKYIGEDWIPTEHGKEYLKKKYGIDYTYKNTNFKFKNNPADNPKVLKDAIVDPNAIYGFRPSKDGSLAKFAKGRWDNPISVSKYRAERMWYHERNEGVTKQIYMDMTAEGRPTEEIAMAVTEFRNQSRINAYLDSNGNVKPDASEGYAAALRRKEENSYERLIVGTRDETGKIIKPPKTPEEIIISAMRGNPGMDACTGLTDLYPEVKIQIVSNDIGKTRYGKSIENTEFFKENGGLDASDYISIHSRKHMYNPDTLSTSKKTQYGKDINVGKLCKDTIMNPDEVIYNTDQNVMIYKKKYPFNISTSETPTGTHRVFIPLNTQGKKTIRMSQFPLFEGD